MLRRTAWQADWQLQLHTTHQFVGIFSTYILKSTIKNTFQLIFIRSSLQEVLNLATPPPSHLCHVILESGAHH